MLIKMGNSSQRFKPHYNEGTGRYYGSSKDYYSDLKAKGLEPYDPSKVKKREEKHYKPSEWARDIVRHADRNGGKIGGVAKAKTMEAQMKKVPKEIKDMTRGGYF